METRQPRSEASIYVLGPNNRVTYRRRRLIHQILTAACWLAIGFGVGVIVTLRAVGFS